MKKILALVLALCMVFALCACSKSDVTEIKYATGGSSGTYYGFSGVIANVLNEKLADTLNITVESTGASKANLQMLDVGEANLAIVQNDVMYYAYTATDLFASEPAITNFSAVASCYPEYIQIVASEDIDSVDDLRGKNVSVGDAGSGCEFNAKQILAAYGMSFDDINVSNQSFADSADSLKNGTIDAAFVVAGYPTTAVTELATSYDFNLVPIEADKAAELQSQYGFYFYGSIPGGTYSCVENDTPAVAVMATIVASNELSEDVIYSFVKGLFDYKAEITASHVKGNELDINTAVSGVSIPWHPGAVKYFAEQGITLE